MDIFVPYGYLTLRAAIERVAAIIHGEKLVSLSEQEKENLAFFDCQQGKLRLKHVPPGESVKMSPLSDAEFQDLERKSSEIAEQQEAAQDRLRQYLYAGRLPSQVLHHEGHRYNIPKHVWGGNEGSLALRSGKIDFRSDSGSVSGLVIIEANALEAAFNPNESTRSTAAVSNTERAPMPRHQYHTRLLEVLEQIWSDIDASDWETMPPKKAAIEADLQNRFSLSERDARAIATVFVPDEKRGKAKKE